MFRSTISTEDRNLVMMVRELVQENIVPRAIEYDSQSNGSFDWSAIDLLAKYNLIAPNIPHEYGGRGLSQLTTAMILEEIAAACAGVATVVSTNLHAISPIITNGSKSQKEKILPLLTEKKAKLGAVTMMANNPSGDIRGAKLNEENGRLILNGYKNYVMNGQVGRFITAIDSSNGDKSGLQVVVLPMSTPGIIIGKNREKLGLRYCDTSEVIFDNVEVEPEHMVGKPGSGFLIFMQNLDRVVPLTGAIGIGIARAAYESALKISKKRFIMGKPSFEESIISFSLVDMANQLNAARLSVHMACWLADNDMDCSQASSKSKIIATQAAQEISRKATEIVGGRACIRGHMSEKYLRDAKMLSLVDGNEQYHKYLIASQL